MMSAQRLLIVHPDGSARALLGSMLRSLGHRIEEAENDRAALRLLDRAPFDLVLVGADAADAGQIDALELLAYVRRKFAGTPVLLISTDPRPERTREAVLRGASRVLRYPIAAAQLRAAVSQAMERTGEPQSSHGNGHAHANGNGHAHANGNGHAHGNGHAGEAAAQAVHAPARDGSAEGDRGDSQAVELIGTDPTLRQALELAEAIAGTRAPVLIVGERGTGKRHLARRLHALGPRRSGPLVEVACGGMRELALEIELFGARPSSDEAARPGKVAQAEGGTLVLNDAASLPPSLQYKLLRLIRDGEYEPVSSTQTRRADCRVVVGSHEDLDTLVAQDRFRSDLCYALGVVTLKLPPLRHRGGDIARLAEHFAARATLEAGRPPVRFTSEAIRALEGHPWPGNVRELKSVVERAVLYARDGVIGPDGLDLALREPAAPRVPAPRRLRPRDLVPLKEALEEPERQIILEALQALNWNRQETARVLDINRTTLYKKMKKYGLLFDEPAWATN
jgi:two-component system response regulator HydG